MKEIKVNIQPDPILPWTNTIKDTEEEIEITVFDGEKIVDVSGMTTELKWRKPTRDITDVALEIKNGKVIASVSKVETDIAGQATCELTLKKKDEESKAYFFVYVEDIRE